MFAQSLKSFFLLSLLATPALAQQIGPPAPRGNFQNQTDRPLRYTPVKGDFLIESANGKGEFFNRPLYGSNTAFRVDAGDLPEFMFYLPNRGGNLRLGLEKWADEKPGGKWLHDAQHIAARYSQGMMIYEIHDPIIGENGRLTLTAVPTHDRAGLILKIEHTGEDLNLFYAFGGSDGLAGSRRGDIGTERAPVSEFFQLTPAACSGNIVQGEAQQFSVKGKSGTIAGITTGDPSSNTGPIFAIADATFWNDPTRLLASRDKPTQTPVALTRTHLPGGPFYLMLQDAATPLPKPTDLAGLFDAARASREKIASTMVLDTPDPFINAAAPALAIAADACWDEQQGVVMHGAVAWRNRLLGWRGPYAMDELGWHDRMTRHLTYWAGQQVTDENIPKEPHADPKKNLAADDWTMLHSNGAMSKSHYDMNLAYIDAYIRHALWTGDTDLLQKTWPVLERHIAWEQRCFRRLYTQNNEPLPLYEAYAAIWASDNLQYNGAGTAHASALNYYHNTMIARIAKTLGKDPAFMKKKLPQF